MANPAFDQKHRYYNPRWRTAHCLHTSQNISRLLSENEKSVQEFCIRYIK
jgi:hypothetical protein